MVEKNIIVGGLNIKFYQSDNFVPSGATIFLHGWGSEALHLKSIFEKCENFVALDLPGFGKSERPREVWSTGSYADFLGKFLEKLTIVNPILVGHSFGGSVIIKYAGAGGDAKKIVLIGSAGIRRRSFKLFFYKAVAKIFNVVFAAPGLKNIKNVLRKKFYQSIGSEDYLQAGEMREIFQKVISEDLSAEMRKITTPSALIWGEDDSETPLEAGREMLKLIAGAKLFVVPGGGHYVFLDKKEEFAKIFFQQLVC